MPPGTPAVPDPRSADDDPVAEAARLLEAATDAVQRTGGNDRLWLLLAVTFGELPLAEDVLRLRRRLELDGGVAGSRFLLDPARWPAAGLSAAPAELARTQVVVDTGHTARWSVTTGIQRVVREVLRRWVPDRDVLPVGWTEGQACTRTLTAEEWARVARWGDARDEAPGAPEPTTRLVLPWHTTVLLAEVPGEQERVERLACLARFSGSRLVVVGYDVIPVTNADAVGPGLAMSFSHYLAALKHADRVVAISRTSAAEFTGYSRALSAQGLRGPEIVSCVLPAEALRVSAGPGPHDADPQDPDDPGPLPLVLCVGSIEPRKNHLSVLHAAEVLWREGLVFRVLLLGKTSALSRPVQDRLAELRRAGRPVELRTDADDAELARAYRDARLSVFVSTHEGFGLPVAESLASGTPVVTSAHGSTAEAAAGGGALLVPVRTGTGADGAITDAVRRLLTDDELHAELVGQCAVRPARTWDDYARELWHHLHPGDA